MRSSCVGKLSNPPKFLAADLPARTSPQKTLLAHECKANKTRKSILQWILCWAHMQGGRSRDPTAKTEDQVPAACDLSPAFKTNAVRASHPDRIVLAKCSAALLRARRRGVHRWLPFRRTLACDATRQIKIAKQASQPICGTTVASGKSCPCVEDS